MVEALCWQDQGGKRRRRNWGCSTGRCDAHLALKWAEPKSSPKEGGNAIHKSRSVAGPHGGICMTSLHAIVLEDAGHALVQHTGGHPASAQSKLVLLLL